MPTIESLARQWDVSLDRKLPGSTCSEVWAGSKDGRGVVLKLPRPDTEEAKSLPTLRAFSEHGGIQVLDYDEDTGACLLPLLGSTIDESELGSDENTRIFARIAMNLRRSEKIEAPTYPEFAHDAFASDDEALREPIRLISKLLDTASPFTLTHGDLHHFNILSSEKGYVAIDPKGILTDPTSEVVAWLRNPRPETITPEKARRRLEIVAEAWGESYDRLWCWAWAGNAVAFWWDDPKTPHPLVEVIRAAR